MTGSLEGRPSAGPVRSPDATESCTSALAGNVKQNLAPRGGLSAAQGPPVRFNNGAADPQSHIRAVSLGGKERIERSCPPAALEVPRGYRGPRSAVDHPRRVATGR